MADLTTSDAGLAYLSIRDLARLIETRQLSPVELVEACLTRIEAHNAGLNAFVYLNREYAIEDAVVAEVAIAHGDYRGPLHGIPTAIKDLNDSRPGWVGTLGGIRALQSYVINPYCNFAERMEKAGATAIGKTNSPTMGFRGTCDNYLFGPTRNPFDATKNSGGSSGGSAAAVAAGFVPFGEGTDGGGSIRIPAAWCGAFGFKGTAGRVARLSRPSAFSTSTLFAFEGCITRSVEDTAFVMQALAGPDARDPYSLTDTVDWLGAMTRSVRGMRIAYSPDLGVFPVDSRVEAQVEAAARAFEEAGAVVEEVRVELHRTALELGDLWCRLQVPTSIVRVENLKKAGIDLLRDHPDDLPPELRHWMDVVRRQDIMDVVRDGEMRTEVYDAIEGVMADYDLLLTPTLACLPVDNSDDGNTLGPPEINGEKLNRLIGWCLTFPLNFTGHPAASVPAGLVEGRWPVGMQIVGRRFQDATVIAASAAYEAIRPWSKDYEVVRANLAGSPP